MTRRKHRGLKVNKYDQFRYLYPPRPDIVISPDRLTFFEKQKVYVAQYKKNGTNSLVWLSPDGVFTTMNRHNEVHKAWTLGPENKEILKGLLPKGLWTCLQFELLHNKAPNLKDTLYIHDILVHDSQYLIGETFENRQKLLEELLPSNAEAYSHFVISNKIWRAKNFKEGFESKFTSIADPKTDEGLVLKKLGAPLKMCDVPKGNSGWCIKVRHPSKMYNY